MLKYGFDPVHGFLWVMGVIIFASLSVYYFYNGVKSDDSKEKKLMLGLTCLWLGLTITRTIQHINYYFVEGVIINHTYYVNTDRISFTYELMAKYSYLSSLVGVIVLFFAIERIIKLTRYIFTSLSSILLIFFFIETKMGKPFLLIELFLLSLMIFWISKRETQIFQAVSAFISIGFIIMAIGYGLETGIVSDLNIILRTIPIILLIFGAIFTFIPRMLTPELYTRSRPIIFWSILISFTLIALPIFINILLIRDIPGELFITLIIGVIIVISILIFGITRIRKIIKEQGLDEEKSPSVLRMFLKPQKLTEEEITLHKKKRICLVCKGKISRINYICPECDALYCEKCSDTLSTLENACWACETIIDEAKPINISK